ncbi:hypothetical protein CRV24_001426 [Beauveria bassiana]|nr:hypothetical protein CRV24_001426 [Beauveria bassiana]
MHRVDPPRSRFDQPCTLCMPLKSYSSTSPAVGDSSQAFTNARGRICKQSKHGRSALGCQADCSHSQALDCSEGAVFSGAIVRLYHEVGKPIHKASSKSFASDDGATLGVCDLAVIADSASIHFRYRVQALGDGKRNVNQHALESSWCKVTDAFG